MIVQAPDGKTIDFGEMPPDQVTGALQKMYPSQASPAYQPTASDRLQQVAQGGTFGFSDEIGAGLGAARMAIDRGSLNNLGEDYNVGLTGLRSDMAQFQKNRPLESMGLQLLGGVPTALGEGTALANSLRGSNLAMRALASSVAGAASGGAYGYGTGEGQDNRLQSAGQGAMVGGVLGAALPVAPAAASKAVASTAQGAKDIVTGFGARSPEELQQATATMKSASSDLYNQMRDVGAVLNAPKVNTLLSEVDQAVASHQFIPELNPKTNAIVNHLKDAAGQGSLGLNELDQYRRLLTRVGSSEDGVSAGAVKRAIDNSVNNITPNDLQNGGMEAVGLLNKGRADFAKSSRFEDVTSILTKADGDPNRIKAGFQRFVADPDNLRGFNVGEISALKEAARTGVGENILKAFGKFGFDFSKSGTGNTVLPALSAITGMAGNPIGIPLALGGTMARQAQKYLARGKAENALRMIEK